jgi:hypothetical protein
MQHCPDCNIRISTPAEFCPLCQKEIAPHEGGESAYPDFEPVKKSKMGLIRLIISIVALTAIAVTVTVNLLTFDGVLWSAIVVANVLYVWLLGFYTFRRKVSTGMKLLAHAITIPAVLVVINIFAFRTATLNKPLWSVSYTMPIILIGFIFILTGIMIIRRRMLREYLVFQIVLCAVTAVPLILVLTGLAQPILPSIIAVCLAYAITIGITIYARKVVRAEFARKFHL